MRVRLQGKRRARRLLPGILAALAALGPGCRHDPGLPPRPPEEPSALRTGRRLYQAWCAGCHGTQGRGDGLGWGTGLPGRPADLTRLGGYNRRTLAEFIARGRPAKFCPGWEANFTPAEIRDLAGFLLAGFPGEEE